MSASDAGEIRSVYGGYVGCFQFSSRSIGSVDVASSSVFIRKRPSFATSYWVRLATGAIWVWNSATGAPGENVAPLRGSGSRHQAADLIWIGVRPVFRKIRDDAQVKRVLTATGLGADLNSPYTGASSRF